jgi:hypothetical protein
VAKINERIVGESDEQAKKEGLALLEVQNTKRQLVDLPVLMLFTCGFTNLCRMGWSVR